MEEIAYKDVHSADAIHITDEQLSKREIQACSMLNHPFIVSYRHSFRHEGLLHLVFDYICDSMNKVRVSMVTSILR